jgi:hypothetical protein
MLVGVPLGVPVVAGGVLLEVLAGSVVELTILEELIGCWTSSSSQRLKDLFVLVTLIAVSLYRR